ncbi:MAG: PhnD/SsuA/transferrin family substrate-binding protein [Burkholderiaceae bacterium]|nr:PhnD/SsuA/transferrin family substrate-binding protein [Burkholderiaceae bacterium]
MRRRAFVECGAALGLTLAGTSIRAATPRLRIGLTAVILSDQAAFLARWSEYLSLRVGVEVVFVARESYQAILDLLFSDQLDAAWICGYPYVRNQARLKLLAVPVYQGEPLYQSYLIRAVEGNSKVNGWSDLKHRVLAYSDPLSNSGWLVAQAQLRAVGLSESDLRRAFFAHGHRNVAEAVATGLAHAGCIDGYVWETMQLQKMASVAKTQVIWKSDFYAFPPIVVRHDDRNGALVALGQALLTMNDEPQGQDLLQALNLNGFSKPAPALFDSIRVLAASVSAARS